VAACVGEHADYDELRDKHERAVLVAGFVAAPVGTIEQRVEDQEQMDGR
jgi:hypothetical protein